MSSTMAICSRVVGALHQTGMNNMAMVVCCRGIGSYKDPPNYDHVKFPLWDTRKLPLLSKVPHSFPGSSNNRPIKYRKNLIDIRGPELVHNKLIHKQFGIQALCGGNLRFGHIESMRLNINRKMDLNRAFAVWRIDPPWKAITKKSQGSRMGGGKGAIKHYVFPVKADRILVEVGGTLEFDEVQWILKISSHKMPFKARVVTQQMLEDEAAEKERLEKLNINPFSFQYAADNNLLGCQQYIGKYDYVWHNKYR